MTARRDFALKDIDVFRPYPDEIPYDLLELAGAEAAQADADLMRVAKLDGQAGEEQRDQRQQNVHAQAGAAWA